MEAPTSLGKVWTRAKALAADARNLQPSAARGLAEGVVDGSKPPS
jgi:hypothetical protein